MTLVRNILKWLGWSFVTEARSVTSEPVQSPIGDIVRRRLGQIGAEMKWPGKDVLLAIGAHEHYLRSALRKLTLLECSPAPAARRAGELRRDVEALLAPDARLAELVNIWPARWKETSHRFVALDEELRVRSTAIGDVLEAARQVESCVTRLDALRSRYATTQPDTWQRVSDGLDLEQAIGRIETGRTAASARRRLDMAEEVLQESETLAVEELVGLREVMDVNEFSDADGREGTSLEDEVARLRAKLPARCEGVIKSAGVRMSEASTTHLRRLTNPTDMVLRTRVLQSLGVEPIGPLLYWARLHHARARALKATRKRA